MVYQRILYKDFPNQEFDKEYLNNYKKRKIKSSPSK